MNVCVAFQTHAIDGGMEASRSQVLVLPLKLKRAQ
jgi:hypothetical protein